MAIDTTGTIDSVLEQVGDDPVLAREAFLAEQENKARKTLLDRLDAIANTPTEPPAGEDDGAGEDPGVSPEASPAGSTAGSHTHRKPSKNTGPTYVARKRLHVPGKVYMPGDVVVEAPTWKRVEGYVRTGYLEVVDG